MTGTFWSTVLVSLVAAGCRGRAPEPPPDEDVIATALEFAREDTDCASATAMITGRGKAPLVHVFEVSVEGCDRPSLYEVSCGRATCDAERKGALGPPEQPDPSQPQIQPQPLPVGS